MSFKTVLHLATRCQETAHFLVDNEEPDQYRQWSKLFTVLRAWDSDGCRIYPRFWWPDNSWKFWMKNELVLYWKNKFNCFLANRQLSQGIHLFSAKPIFSNTFWDFLKHSDLAKVGQTLQLSLWMVCRDKDPLGDEIVPWLFEDGKNPCERVKVRSSGGFKFAGLLSFCTASYFSGRCSEKNTLQSYFG